MLDDSFDVDTPPSTPSKKRMARRISGSHRQMSFSSENLSRLTNTNAPPDFSKEQKILNEAPAVISAAAIFLRGKGKSIDYDIENPGEWELERLTADSRGSLGESMRKAVDSMKLNYFFFGLTSGASFQMFLVSFGLMYVSASLSDGPLNELSKMYYPIFRMVFFIVWFFSLYGCALFILKRHKVDYFRVLDLPRTHTYNYVIRGAASTAYLIFTCLVMYVLTISGVLDNILHISKHLWPLLSILLPTVIFFYPSDMMTNWCFGVKKNGFAQRWNFLRQLGAVLSSPFSKPTRIRCLIADVMCSMPRIFSDMLYTIYFYGTWELDKEFQKIPETEGYFFLCTYLAILPYSLRALQVLRIIWDEPERSQSQIFNLVKYTLSVSVTLLNVMQKGSTTGSSINWKLLWQVVALITSLMSYYSDVVLGWGLFQPNTKNLFLRDNLTFPKWSYYLAMASNLFFRSFWAINISPGQPYVAQNFVLLIGCAELFRRNIWLIFRLENMTLQDVSLETKLSDSLNGASSLNGSCDTNAHQPSNYGALEVKCTEKDTMLESDKDNLPEKGAPFKVSFEEMQNIKPTIPVGV